MLTYYRFERRKSTRKIQVKCILEKFLQLRKRYVKIFGDFFHTLRCQEHHTKYLHHTKYFWLKRAQIYCTTQKSPYFLDRR